MIITCTPDNLPELLSSGKPLFLDFWAQWCGPCRTLAPILDELDAKFGDQAVFAKLNVDDHSALAAKYNVRAIPTCLLFVDGKLQSTHPGLQTLEQYTALIQPHV
jgi:thioredoxin 1